MRILLATLVLLLTGAVTTRAAVPCGALPSDQTDITDLRPWIEQHACPCATFDGSSPARNKAAYRSCTRATLRDASDGTPIQGLFSIRPECRSQLTKLYKDAACGYPALEERHPCCQRDLVSGRARNAVKRASRCRSSASGRTVRHVCPSSPFLDACSNDATNSCTPVVYQQTLDIPSAAQPAQTPGSPGVVVSDARLIAQFGGTGFSLNRARYTRFRLNAAEASPDAILVLVPGFEGGAGDFNILAENLIPRLRDLGLALEVWAFDRRTNQLEDSAGSDLAEAWKLSPLGPSIALDWYFGGELSLPLHPVLAAGPNRRANFYNTQADLAFFAGWTNLVFSQDIDAVVTAARAAARNDNVFLGGHSAGTGFAARYVSTDFNLSGVGPADPGYAKLRGLVLLEGGGGSTAGGAAITDDTLDRIEAKFDGGLYGAVRDNAGRCVNGTTPCTVANEATACAGQVPPKCTPAAASYAVVSGLLSPRVLAAVEPSAIQGFTDPDGGQIIITVDQGAPNNSAVKKVPDLSGLALLPVGTVEGGIGSFVDDDGIIAQAASFVATSVGYQGATVGGLLTWLDSTEGPFPAAAVPNNGPQPTTLSAGPWGQEKEVTSFPRLLTTFYEGGTNFTDWYYPSAGPSTTSVTGVCTAGTCTAGNVGASCANANQCSQAINLDSTRLSVDRGRRDIENLTQAPNVDIPVLGIGGSNGLARVPGAFTAFAQSIAPCTAPSCTGMPRVVNATSPNPAFPTLGGINGGFEVVIAEGFAHVDVLTAEDDANNPVPAALASFIERNVQ